jgi:hypothetical protein
LPRQKGERRALQGHRGAGSAYCPAHDPAREGARRRAASKAARSKPDAEVKGVKDGSMPSPTACSPANSCGRTRRSSSQVLNVKLRALERERKWKELGELEDRLEALERVLKGRNAG